MAINLLHAHGRYRLLPKTGRTTKVLDYDDGDLETGFQLAPANRFKATGYGTIIDLVTGLEWITNPYKMILQPGVRTDNSITTATGTWALNTSYTKGQVMGRGPNVVQQMSGGGYAYNYYYDSHGVVWYCQNDAYSDPSYELWYYGTVYWLPGKSHASIYICIEDHTSQADHADWAGSTLYDVGDVVRDYDWFYMQYGYFKCNTQHWSQMSRMDDWDKWDTYDLSDEWALDEDNWLETDWISNADPTTGGPAPIAIGAQCAVLTEAHALEYAGRTDWRVPNAVEALSLMDFEAAYDGSLTDFYAELGITKGYQFWTNTRPPSLGNPNYTWVVARYGETYGVLANCESSALFKFPLFCRGGGFTG